MRAGMARRPAPIESDDGFALATPAAWLAFGDDGFSIGLGQQILNAGEDFVHRNLAQAIIITCW
jgi:hypothetical protein